MRPDIGHLDSSQDSRSDLAFSHAELRARAGVDDADAFAIQKLKKSVGLLIRQQKFDLHGQIAGQLEEMLLVEHAVSSVAGDRAERRASVNTRLLRLFQ